MNSSQALVIFGDVVGSRRDSTGSTAWLRDLVAELNDVYKTKKLADFGFTQGDEVQGLLASDADPMDAVLHAALGRSARPIRWVCIWGSVDPAPRDDPATQHTGEAFIEARAAIAEARSGHDRLIIRTGRPAADALLDGMTPALMDLLDDLTQTQRVVARLAIVEGLRQSEVAERLKVRRATISVSFARAKINSLQHLVEAIRLVYREVPAGVSGAAGPAGILAGQTGAIAGQTADQGGNR